MNTCIYSKAAFASASDEHILQNFLGARWTDSTIVCDEVQKLFGETIDPAFEEGVRPIRTLMGTKSGRRDEAPPLKGIQTIAGQKVDLQSGGKPRLSRPHVQCQQEPDGGHKVSITLGNASQAGWALAELKKQFPHIRLTAQELLGTAQPQQGRLESPVHIPFKLGGVDYIRGATKACFNLLAAHKINVLSTDFDPAREFILKGNGVVEDFFRWPIQNVALASKLGPIDHFIGLMSRNGKVEGVLVLFGNIPHTIRLANMYTGPAFKIGYIVDPLRESSPAESRTPLFPDDMVLDFDMQPIKPNKDTWETFAAAIKTSVQCYQRLSTGKVVQETVDEILGKPDGTPITAAHMEKLRQKLVQKLFGTTH